MKHQHVLVVKNRFNFKTKMRKFFNCAFSPRYLLLTNLIISSSLSGIGDVIEQRYEILIEEIPEWDPLRTRNMTISGVTTGYITHCWYDYLQRCVPGCTIRMVIQKVLLDQFIFSPISITTFFCTMAVLEGTNTKTLIEELKQKGWRLYAAEWVIWPPAQFINFYLLPHRFRLLYDSAISLFYDIYTSSVKHRIALRTTE